MVSAVEQERATGVAPGQAEDTAPAPDGPSTAGSTAPEGPRQAQVVAAPDEPSASPPAAGVSDRAAPPAAGSAVSVAAPEVPAAGSASPDPTPAADPALEALAGRVDELQDRIAGLERAVVAGGDEAAASAAGWTDVAAAVSGVADRSAAIESRQDAAEAATADLDTRLSGVLAAGRDDRTDLAAVRAEVATLRDTVQGLTEGTAVDIAREVERHTTAALVDGQQRLHQASVAMAGLAQSLADAARSVPVELTAESAQTLLESFAVDVDLVLQQLGHEPLGVLVGAPFDPRRHRALRRVTTTDPAADRTVARVLRDGYLTPTTDRVLVFADVEVHRYVPTEPATGQEGS